MLKNEGWKTSQTFLVHHQYTHTRWCVRTWSDLFSTMTDMGRSFSTESPVTTLLLVLLPRKTLKFIHNLEYSQRNQRAIYLPLVCSVGKFCIALLCVMGGTTKLAGDWVFQPRRSRNGYPSPRRWQGYASHRSPRWYVRSMMWSPSWGEC